MSNAGIDVGMLWTKAVVLNGRGLLGWHVCLTGDDAAQAAARALQGALASAGVPRDALGAVTATGAGKGEARCADRQAAEIVCLAAGARFVAPDAAGVIDMGAESTLVVKLDADGAVADYARNDKCAAGTGVFLDAVAKVMGIAVEDMGPLSLTSTAEIAVTSMCVVFAESEVVSQIHRQTPKQDILKGIHRSIATRIATLAGRVDLGAAPLVAGGLARNSGILSCLESMMKRPLAVPEHPQLVSALGAALTAPNAH